MARVRRRSTTRNRSSFTLLLVLAGLLVVLIVLHVIGPLKPVEGVVLRLLRPGMSATQTVGSETGGLFSTLSGIGSLPKENAVLREEVDRLLVEAARVEELERENALLREQLGFVEEAQAETVPAFVIVTKSLAVEAFEKQSPSTFANAGRSVSFQSSVGPGHDFLILPPTLREWCSAEVRIFSSRLLWQLLVLLLFHIFDVSPHE